MLSPLEGTREEEEDDDYENSAPPYKDLPPKPSKCIPEAGNAGVSAGCWGTVSPVAPDCGSLGRSSACPMEAVVVSPLRPLMAGALGPLPVRWGRQ